MKCLACDHELATDAELVEHPEDCQHCKSLCWSPYNIECTHLAVDWRARAIAAEELVAGERQDAIEWLTQLRNAQKRITALETRQQELLATIVRLTNEVPLPDEVKGWTEQRARMVAEIGTLRSRSAELEAGLAEVCDLLAEVTEDEPDRAHARRARSIRRSVLS